MRNYWKNGNIKDCCGCSACFNICPKKCISMQCNDEGFLLPIKDSSLCIECGLCEKVCSFSDNYIYQTTDSPVVFAAYDEVNRIGSSSGGIFYTLAKYVIEERNGWVFGAAFEDHFQLRHVGVNNMKDLQKLRGSKYLQSDMGNVYQQIKALLIEGIFVFFVGTPCQVAGLRAFLRNKEYNNLLTADLVCHGVPPQSLFDKHVEYLEQKHKATLVSYQFRKSDGWGGSEICDFANPNKHIESPSYFLSPYLFSFMNAYTYRESCYMCKFAQVPRQGDITLADFWGVTNYFPMMDVSKGVSLVLLNTKIGEVFFELIKNICIVEQSNLDAAARNNGNLVMKTKRPKLRDKVYSEIKQQGYKPIAETVFKLKNERILKIKLWLFSIPFVKQLFQK